MERDQLHLIAKLLFEVIPVCCWESKSANEMETAVQGVVSELATVLMEAFILPGRVRQLEQQVQAGQIRCPQCQSPYRLHQPDQAIHPKTIFGSRICFSRPQYYCPGCDDYQMVADRVLGWGGAPADPPAGGGDRVVWGQLVF